MTISQRAKVDDVLCDVVCTGRFYDFFEKRGRWGLVLRQPIYEKDRLDPLDPSAKLDSTRPCWRAFPKATATSPICRRASATRSSRDMPGLDGPEVDGAVREGRAVAEGGGASTFVILRCPAKPGLEAMAQSAAVALRGSPQARLAPQGDAPLLPADLRDELLERRELQLDHVARGLILQLQVASSNFCGAKVTITSGRPKISASIEMRHWRR